MAYKYDTLTNTYTQLTNIPMDFIAGTVSAIGTDIYLINGIYAYSSNSKQVYKYNTLTGVYTRLNDVPTDIHTGSACTIGTDIYLFGSGANDYKKYAYKYNTLNDTYTRLTDIPYNYNYGSAVVYNTDVYLFGGSGSSESSTTAYKYDTLTDTYTQITDIPYEFTSGSAVIVDTNIYVLGGSRNPTKVQVYALQSKTYQQDNLVVVEQGKYKGAGYSIELYNNPKDIDSPKYQFVDAWFYTTNDGLITDIPTYYGDGTQWINFKNPPTTN